MNLQPQDHRRPTSRPEEPASPGQTAMLVLQPFEDGETAGPVFHVKYATKAKYPATAGAATLSYGESSRKELCWADPAQFAVDDVVIAVKEGNRWYAIAKLA